MAAGKVARFERVRLLSHYLMMSLCKWAGEKTQQLLLQAMATCLFEGCAVRNVCYHGRCQFKGVGYLLLRWLPRPRLSFIIGALSRNCANTVLDTRK